jgi:hypothetical protein
MQAGEAREGGAHYMIYVARAGMHAGEAREGGGGAHYYICYRARARTQLALVVSSPLRKPLQTSAVSAHCARLWPHPPVQQVRPSALRAPPTHSPGGGGGGGGGGDCTTGGGGGGGGGGCGDGDGDWASDGGTRGGACDVHFAHARHLHQSHEVDGLHQSAHISKSTSRFGWAGSGGNRDVHALGEGVGGGGEDAAAALAAATVAGSTARA